MPFSISVPIDTLSQDVQKTTGAKWSAPSPFQRQWHFPHMQSNGGSGHLPVRYKILSGALILTVSYPNSFAVLFYKPRIQDCDYPHLRLQIPASLDHGHGHVMQLRPDGGTARYTEPEPSNVELGCHLPTCFVQKRNEPFYVQITLTRGLLCNTWPNQTLTDTRPSEMPSRGTCIVLVRFTLLLK